jgi:short-subunit dehydrogenase
VDRKLAAITGASSGIGRALALEFAARGFDLLLVGRDKNALEAVEEKCENDYGVKTRIFITDLADGEKVDELGRSFENVDILVNNAGFGVKGDFAETDLGDELKMLNVQIAAVLKLTKAVLPGMIARKTGRILNIASVYSFSAVPKQSVYSACKAFILSFSSALREEVKDRGVTVTVVCPGITQTEFRTRAGITDKKNSGMTAEAVARIAVEATLKGKHIVVPGAQNRLFVFLARHLPQSLMTWVVRSINNRRGVNQ